MHRSNQSPFALLTDTTLETIALAEYQSQISDHERDVAIDKAKRAIDITLKRAALLYDRIYIFNLEADQHLYRQDGEEYLESVTAVDEISHGLGTSMLPENSGIYQNENEFNNLFQPLLPYVDDPDDFLSKAEGSYTGTNIFYDAMMGQKNQDLWDLFFHNQTYERDYSNSPFIFSLTNIPIDFAVWEAVKTKFPKVMIIPSPLHISALQKLIGKLNFDSKTTLVEKTFTIGIGDLTRLKWDEIFELRQNRSISECRKKFTSISESSTTGNFDKVKELLSDISNIEEMSETGFERTTFTAIMSNMPLDLIPTIFNDLNDYDNIRLKEGQRISDKYGWTLFAEGV